MGTMYGGISGNSLLISLRGMTVEGEAGMILCQRNKKIAITIAITNECVVSYAQGGATNKT